MYSPEITTVSGAPQPRRLLLIRLFQEATISSVGVCRACHFREICVGFSVSLRPTRPVRSTSSLVGGPTGSDARDVHTRAPTPSGTKFL